MIIVYVVLQPIDNEVSYYKVYPICHRLEIAVPVGFALNTNN